jgi:rhamnulokinase
VLRNVTGLWVFEECRRACSRHGRERSVEELVARARAAPPLRSLIDPNDATFTPPGDMPARIADYCGRSGQDVPEDEGAVVRCIFESLALKHAETVDLIASLTDRELDTLHVVGGGARNELLCEWTAAAAERPVQAGPTEATVVGNLLVQAMALGEIGSLEEAREVAGVSFPTAAYEPASTAAWREARDRFAALSGARPELQVTT